MSESFPDVIHPLYRTMLEQIQEICPTATLEVVLRDLSKTGRVELTLNRLFDGSAQVESSDGPFPGPADEPPTIPLLGAAAAAAAAAIVIESPRRSARKRRKPVWNSDADDGDDDAGGDGDDDAEMQRESAAKKVGSRDVVARNESSDEENFLRVNPKKMQRTAKKRRKEEEEERREGDEDDDDDDDLLAPSLLLSRSVSTVLTTTTTAASTVSRRPPTRTVSAPASSPVASSKMTKQAAVKAAREAKQAERAEARHVKSCEAAKQAAAREQSKRRSRADCLAALTCTLGAGLEGVDEGRVLAECRSLLTEQGVTVEMDTGVAEGLLGCVVQWRRCESRYDAEGTEVVEHKSTVDAQDVMVIVSGQQLVDMACSESLVRDGGRVAQAFPQQRVTLLIVGLGDVYRRLGRNKSDGGLGRDVSVARDRVDEALLDLQFACIYHRVCDSAVAAAEQLGYYSVAIAERPYAKMKPVFLFHASSERKPKSNHKEIWFEQLRTVPGIAEAAAQAIVGAYPSPAMLLEAYRRCEPQQRPLLLAGVQVRRHAGLVNLGKVASRRFAQIFLSFDPDVKV